MVMRMDTHVLLDLTEYEASLLRELLQAIAEHVEKRSAEGERLLMSLLAALPH